MSHDGKMRRGAKWYSHRDVSGNLPKDIADDPGKMCDVEYYLANQPKEEPKNKEGKTFSEEHEETKSKGKK